MGRFGRTLARLTAIALVVSALIWFVELAGESLAFLVALAVVSASLLVRPSGRWRGGLLGHPARALRALVWLGPLSRPTERRRFRVAASNRQLDCELFGELTGAVPQRGDRVLVHGRWTRHGTLRVRQLVLAGTGSSVRPQLPPGVRAARVAGTVIVLAGGFVLLSVALGVVR